MTSRFTLSTAGALLLLVVTLAACAPPDASPLTPQPTATAADAAPSVAPVSTPSPTDAGSQMSCESMISPGTVEALTGAGWTAQPTPFVIGEVELTEGLLCLWADYSVGSDHGQLYGWSEISADDAAKAQADLIAAGWTREDGPEGVHITEDPRYSMGTDGEGYGITYLFGDGWVKMADTKQSLLLIEGVG